MKLVENVYEAVCGEYADENLKRALYLGDESALPKKLEIV